MRPAEIQELAQLSVPEKILFVEDLWDDIASGEHSIAVPESHKKELKRRLERHQRNPGNLLSIEELQANIEIQK
jgi:putative addiction module component (TIGR02574 family)